MNADVVLINPSYIYPPYGPGLREALYGDALVMDLPSTEFLYPPIGLLSIAGALKRDGAVGIEQRGPLVVPAREGTGRVALPKALSKIDEGVGKLLAERIAALAARGRDRSGQRLHLKDAVVRRVGLWIAGRWEDVVLPRGCGARRRDETVHHGHIAEVRGGRGLSQSPNRPCHAEDGRGPHRDPERSATRGLKLIEQIGHTRDEPTAPESLSVRGVFRETSSDHSEGRGGVRGVERPRSRRCLST